MSSNHIAPTDLTQRPPRSPRVRLGGYAILPRILDKGRAQLAGRHGEYKFACPLDQHFFDFTGLKAEDLLRQLEKGKGDAEVLAWIEQTAPQKRGPWEIAQWSAYHEARCPSDPEGREHFNEMQRRISGQREDVATWFDLLDLDDYLSFGGRG